MACACVIACGLEPFNSPVFASRGRSHNTADAELLFTERVCPHSSMASLPRLHTGLCVRCDACGQRRPPPCPTSACARAGAASNESLKRLRPLCLSERMNHSTSSASAGASLVIFFAKRCLSPSSSIFPPNPAPPPSLAPHTLAHRAIYFAGVCFG